MDFVDVLLYVLPLLFLAGWMGLIYNLGKRDKMFSFYSLIFAPYVLALFLLFVGVLGSAIMFTADVFGLLLLFVVVCERVFWGLSLYDASGYERSIWFVIIFLVPVFGWVLYRSINLQD